MTSHMTNSCHYRMVVCEHCSVSYLFIAEEMHMEVCEEVLVECQLCKTDLPRRQLEEHTSDLCPKKLHVCGYADVGCTEKVLLEDLSFHESHATQHHLSFAMNRIHEQDNKINELRSKLSALSDVVYTSQAISAFKDEEVFKIYPFDRLFKEAKAGKDCFIHNFFALNGYHCQVRLLLNGNNKTQRRHMSIDIIIPRGPFDYRVEWPMRATISFGLFRDGGSRRNIYTFSTRTPSVHQVFNKAGVNASAGISFFLPHNCVQDYVVDNALGVFAKVRPLDRNQLSHKVECIYDWLIFDKTKIDFYFYYSFFHLIFFSLVYLLFFVLFFQFSCISKHNNQLVFL